jgi:hypothetical protein
MLTVGEQIDALQKLKERKKDAETVVSDLEKQIEASANNLIELMEAQGVVRSTGRLATASISESIKPQVQDWAAFYDFIARHKYFHLLDRRPSVTGCRELFETKGVIPGVVPFTKKTIRTTTLG